MPEVKNQTPLKLALKNITALWLRVNKKSRPSAFMYTKTMTSLSQIIGDYDAFLKDILSRVAAEGFDFSDFIQIDHMCYRTTSLKNYEDKKSELQMVAKLLGETEVNGRPIATFRLNQPVFYETWRIDAIELPAPKAGSDHKEGLEHIEFVLFDDIPTFLSKYKNKPFETRASNRGINPEIGLPLGDLSVKFHLLNLPTVLYLEQKLGIKAVKDEQN